MKPTYYLALIFALSLCKGLSAQTASAVSTLPDLDLIGRTCDAYRKNNEYAKAANLYFETAEKLQSSELYVYAAWQYGLADDAMAALQAINKSIDRGMCNPYILKSYQLEEAGVGSPLRREVDRRLDSLQQSLKKISHFDIVTTPLTDFWPYFNQAMHDKNKASTYFETYIKKGGTAVKDYYHIRYENANNMVQQMIDKTPTHYQYTENFYKTTGLKAVKKKMFDMMVKFSKIYPDAVYPKVYLVAGILTGNGTQTELGLFIGAEMFVESPTLPTQGLSDWQRDNIAPLADMIYVTIHELMHFQQSYKDDQYKDKLLGKTIEEGVCDFLVELVSSKATLAKSRRDNIAYLEKPENMKRIGEAFKKDRYTSDLALWMYNGGAIQDRPSDLAYTMGYLICKSYYVQSSDKKAAVKEMLQTDDFRKIIRGSTYAYLLD